MVIEKLFLHQPMIAALHYIFLFMLTTQNKNVSFDLSPVLPSALPSVATETDAFSPPLTKTMAENVSKHQAASETICSDFEVRGKYDI